MKNLCSCICMIGIVLWLLSCSSSQEITLKQAQDIQDCRIYAVLHTPYKNYHLYDFTLTTDSLTGYLYPARTRYGTFLNFHTSKRVYGKVNKKTHPYFAAHVSEITKTATSEESGDSAWAVYCIIELILCASWGW